MTRLLVLFALVCAGSARAADSPHLLLGNPSTATKDPEHKDNFLLTKEHFCLSYNNTKGTPNWVSWQVAHEHLGDAPRKQTFATDNHLPKEFRHVTHQDYSGSGFDRGHLCPHSDRAADKEMSFATFVMTNIVPQTPALNQKAWNSEEEYLRGLLKKKAQRRLYVIAGPAGVGGGPKDAPVRTIAEGNITVPAVCWKVAVVVDGGESWKDDLGWISKETRVIAVVMPNDDTPGVAWAKYRVPVRDIETLTGYTFFDRLPPDLQKALKAKADDEPIPAAKARTKDD